MHVIAHPDARSALLAAGLVLALLAPAAAPAQAATPSPAAGPPGLSLFMELLGPLDSGGRYDAHNPSSGAFGRFQILPSNWPGWAARYLGDRNAKPTPGNQDRIAAGRLTDLYHAYRSWERVAYWWLTGRSGPPSTWSPAARRYIARIMTRYRLRAATPVVGSDRILDDRTAAISWVGTWHEARHAGYSGGRAHYSTARGAAATVHFTGRSVRIEGPTGPTRGKVRVLVDGRFVRTVDLRSAHFRVRATIFAFHWAQAGAHRIELQVEGTPGRPYVAVDRVVIVGG